jgi:hypothetical protein
MAGKYPGIAPFVENGGAPAFGEWFTSSSLAKKLHRKKKQLQRMNKKH